MELIDFHTHRETAEGVVTPRSFAIHPWDAEKEKASGIDEFRAKYRSRFDDAQLIGECGLDKACSVGWQRQQQLFLWHIAIAEEQQKPMVIHCVRAFNELSALRRQHPQGTWVVHGFTGSLQLADQLFRQGILVSFGAALLDPRRTKVRECLKDTPHPFLLETDDSPCGIEAVYRAAAEIRKTTPDLLASTIKKTYMTLFNN